MRKGLFEPRRHVSTATVPSSPRAVKPYVFPRLERVHRQQVHVLNRLPWLVPDGLLVGEWNQKVQQALSQIFDETVAFKFDHVHCCAPEVLPTVMGDPTFLALVALAPQGARGVVEVDLELAHAMIDLLLGASEESALVRPLTEMEQGVMSFILIGVLKAFCQEEPAQGKHPFRFLRVIDNIEEGLGVFTEEISVAVVEMAVRVSTSLVGSMRMYFPSSAINAAVPPQNSGPWRERRQNRIRARSWLLSSVHFPLRAEICRVELASKDIAALRAGDVMLIGSPSVRPDQGARGKARLRFGAGRCGVIDAAVEVVNGTYQAKIEALKMGVEPSVPPELDAAISNEQEGEDRVSVDEENEESLPEEIEEIEENEENENALEFFNDVPLQVMVELARVPLTAEEIVDLHVGQVIDLRKAPGETVDLSVNGKVIARGVLVEIEGQLGVRIGAMAE